MAGQAAPIATGQSGARRCRPRRPVRMARSRAPAASDTLAPTRSATPLAPPQCRRPDAETCVGRVDEGVAPPHPSQTRMCRFPASGSSWESLAHGGVTVDDPGGRQWVALEECSEPAPVELVPVTPPRQPCLPGPRDLSGVPAQSSSIARYAVVGIVAPHHRSQMSVLVRDRLMSVEPTPSRHRRQRAGIAALGRDKPHHILAGPRLVPDEGKAEEGERGPIRLRMVSPIWPVIAEIDEVRLVGMQLEAIPRKSHAQNAKDPLGIEVILECHHGIISKADKGTSARKPWPHLVLEPFLQHVVQENVRETG